MSPTTTKIEKVTCSATIDDGHGTLVRCQLPPHGPDARHRAITASAGTLFWTDDDDDDTDVQTAADAIAGTVDGQEAQIVLDGTTGVPVDGEQLPLLEAHLHELELSIARKYDELANATEAAKDAAAHKKAVQEELNSMIEELSRRVRAPEAQQQPLFANVTQPENDELHDRAHEVDDPDDEFITEEQFDALKRELDESGAPEGDGSRGRRRVRPGDLESAPGEGPI